MYDIVPCTWRKYRSFVNLCCVSTMPFPGGPCWVIEPEVAFIGYNYSYYNNSQRNLIFPEKLICRRYFDLDFLNQNFRCLNRVMVNPKYRRQGLATKLITETLPKVGVRYIECLTFAELIRNILLRCGFQEYGESKTGSCRYYLFDVESLKNPKNP